MAFVALCTECTCRMPQLTQKTIMHIAYHRHSEGVLSPINRGGGGGGG